MTLALIPARGGSKGIPRKNIRPIAGKPLIAWTIEAARAVPGIERVVVSTDDPEIAAVAEASGADVPFMRPAELATDEAPGIAPVLHAVEMLPGHDTLILLQPTSPLRGSCEIADMLAFCERSAAHSVASVTPVQKPPAWMYHLESDRRLSPYAQESTARRQDLPELFVLNGAMYWVETEWLLREQRLVGPGTLGFPMDAQSSVDIDTMLDWRFAEMLLTERAGATIP